MFSAIFASLATVCLAAEKADRPANLPWEEIQSGKYKITAIVPERKGEPLSRIINAAEGSLVDVVVDDEAIEVRLVGKEKAIRLPRSEKENAGKDKQPYTDWRKKKKLMQVIQQDSKQRMTFAVIYVGHFVLESVDDDRAAAE